MKDIVGYLFPKYKEKVILIDTNILLLWFVGMVNRERILKFNRTEKLCQKITIFCCKFCLILTK